MRTSRCSRLAGSSWPSQVRQFLRRRYRARLSHAQLWRRELPSEEAFWRDYIRTRGGQFPEEFRYRMDPDAPLDDPIVGERLDRMPDGVVSILDIGAGPLTALGKRHPGKTLSITPVDPLADVYDRLLAEAAVTPLVRTIRCRGEELLERFGRERFDVVYARNSLDHSEDPMRIIEHALALLKPGGFLVARHYENEAEVMSYEELHQWNFECRRGALFLWSPRVEHDVGARLAGRATVECFTHPGSYHAAWVVGVITKTA